MTNAEYRMLLDRVQAPGRQPCGPGLPGCSAALQHLAENLVAREVSSARNSGRLVSWD